MPKKKIRNSPTKGLSKAELKLISVLLEEASNDLSNNGCNDYEIPATEENKTIMISILQDNDNGNVDDEEIADILNSKDEIITFDFMLAGYFARRCKKLSEKK